MITILGACLFMGCVDVPIVVGNGGIGLDIDLGRQFVKEDKDRPACYVDGVFYPSCPR